MPVSLLMVGGPSFRDYARLRDALDVALANRFPDVQLVTIGGPGVPALVASYARSRGLPLVVTQRPSLSGVAYVGGSRAK